MGQQFNLRAMTIASTGTGALTLGAAVAPFKALNAAPAIPTGTFLSYRIDHGSDWELSEGFYNAAAGTITRNLVESSTGSLIDITGAATVALVPHARDFDTFQNLAIGQPLIVIPGRGQDHMTIIGGTFQTMSTEMGQSITPTNLYTQTARRRSSSTPSGIGQRAGHRARGGGTTARRDVGFRARCSFGFGDAGPTARWFVGFSANGFLAGTSAEPSTFTEIMGIGGQSGSTTASWYENDASGTATMTALGTGSKGGTAPTNTADTEIYDIEIYQAVGANPILTVRRRTTGDVWTRTPTTDLPGVTVGLCFQLWRDTGATASIANVDLFGYVEEPV